MVNLEIAVAELRLVGLKRRNHLGSITLWESERDVGNLICHVNTGCGVLHDHVDVGAGLCYHVE